MQPFEAIVAEHGAVVMRVCRALLGPVDADDAWSETFLAALRAYPGLRPGSNVAGNAFVPERRPPSSVATGDHDLPSRLASMRKAPEV